jgi:NADPH:quinone reductase-like Zn-dependent oxidoreductase
MSQSLSRVLVVGAAGGVGRRAIAVAAAQRHDLPVTTLVRDVARRESFAASGEEPTVVREDIARLAAHRPARASRARVA